MFFICGCDYMWNILVVVLYREYTSPVFGRKPFKLHRTTARTKTIHIRLQQADGAELIKTKIKKCTTQNTHSPNYGHLWWYLAYSVEAVFDINAIHLGKLWHIGCYRWELWVYKDGFLDKKLVEVWCFFYVLARQCTVVS